MNKPTEIEEISINYITSDNFPLNLDDVRFELRNDEILCKVYEYVSKGNWPQYVKEELKPFYIKRNSSTDSGCLFYAEKLVIPKNLIYRVLSLLHESHVGIVRKKAIARTYVWWPGVDKYIEDFVNSCGPCQTVQNSPKPILSSWKNVTYPFERIHIDFCKIGNITILVLFDVFSKWIDCIIMKKTGAKTKQMELSAERAVQTVKQPLKKILIDDRTKHLNWDLKLNNFLLQYRSTPSTVTNTSPAKLLFTYKPRTLMDVLVNKKDNSKKQKDKEPKPLNSFNSQENILPKDRIINTNEEVLYRNVFSNYVKWIPGRILNKVSSLRYMVLVNGSVKHAHSM
ncbi:hypothetical protein CVS40_12943 [Lucilia cuprina]|nr:hypothetical protein CVS40_12943 [Lucilia cuprina]